ncbi:MAG: XkdF-like putative serine protease domain-containing protein [Bacteroidota bacterium]
MDNTLPIYRFVVGENDEAEVTAVALVDTPAIEINWQAFNHNVQFKSDSEKRIISGALMVADLPIYRRDELGEYYGVFTAEDVYNIRNKFHKKQYGHEVNAMHNPKDFIEGVYMIESFIIDSERGIHSPQGFNLKDGSWFGSYKVDNEDVWNDFIKTGKFRGFSVEGVFGMEKIDRKPVTIIEQIIDIVKQIKD